MSIQTQQRTHISKEDFKHDNPVEVSYSKSQSEVSHLTSHSCDLQHPDSNSNSNLEYFPPKKQNPIRRMDLIPSDVQDGEDS